MRTTIIRFYLFACLVFLSCSVSAKIALPECFSDNMVLQQQTDAPIWGKADPKENVKIITSWDEKTYTAFSDADGKWSVKVATPQAGGPYSIRVSDGKEVILNNVLIGEVWICSGQSNMEMPLAGWGKVMNYEAEIAAANYPDIRLLQVKKATNMQPADELKTDGGWQVCSPATIAEFSSVAYFFGRDLQQNLNIPIGLIHTSWGGTIAEAWTSGESLKEMPDFKETVQTMEKRYNVEWQKLYDEQLKAWNETIGAADKGIEKNLPLWAEKNYSDTDWKQMNLPVLWEKSQLPDMDGIVWFRKSIEIPVEWEGKDLQLRLEMIDDNDITYFNGKEIGATEGHNMERNYTVPGKSVKKGTAVIAVRVTDTGGDGGIYGEPSRLSMGLKSGESTEKIALSGDWKYRISVDFKDFPAKPQSPDDPNRPTVLYNAMIYPLLPYGIQGAIWYQGESNVGRASQYKELFPLMIRDWRRVWNRDFPFYFVQLANFMERKTTPQPSAWAELREAQFETLNLENTGMAVTIDVGDAADIHPKNKQEVGRRLALAARANTYHQNILFSGPLYTGYTLEKNRMRIHFQQAEGLQSADGKVLTGFEIAGSDHRFRWAEAKIEGNDVIVYSPEVKYPVAVRYAWADNPACNLINSAGLPASPFRTDDWK